MFKDRLDAGVKLGEKLMSLKNEDILVLAIPNGGVEVGMEVAKILNKPIHLIISRKLPMPFSPEVGFGAIAEDGTCYFDKEVSQYLDEETKKSVIETQLKVISDKISILRNNEPLVEMKNLDVLLVDDGLAIGSTVMAAIYCCKTRGVKRIILAVPVASESAVKKVKRNVDQLVVLDVPADFYGVSQVYNEWTNLTEKDVLKILGKQ